MEIIRCIDEHDEYSSVFSIAIRRFINEVSLSSSVDTILIKLSTLLNTVYSLEKEVDTVAQKVFSCREVLEVMAFLSSYREFVKAMIDSDPRHSSLKPYKSYILQAIDIATNLSLGSERRPPLDISPQIRSPHQVGTVGINTELVVCASNPLIAETIKIFLAEVSSVRTIDGYLVKLASLIDRVAEYIRDEAKAVRVVLRCKEVAEALAPLASYTNNVMDAVLTDPRHSRLRPYLDQILATIRALPVQEGSMVKSFKPTRPPTWYIERYETWQHESPFVKSYKDYKSGHRVEFEKPFESMFSKPIYEAKSLKRRGVYKRIAKYTIIAIAILFAILLIAYFILMRVPLMSTILQFASSKIAANSTYLVVEYQGRWLPEYTPYLSIGSIDLVYFLTDDIDKVSPIRVYVSRSHSYAVFNVSEILSKLRTDNSTPLYVKIYNEDKKCKARIENNTIYFGLCESVIYMLSGHYTFVTFGAESVHEAIIRYIDNSTLSFLRSKFSMCRGDKYYTLWCIARWLEDNATYDTLKAWSPIAHVISPTEFYNTRKGVCSDYALFTASVLLTLGFDKVYILEFKTGQGFHAVAAAEVDNKLYVVDQRLPVYEWQDYVEYVFKPIGYIQMIRIFIDTDGIAGFDAILTTTNELSNMYPDTHPFDTLPPYVVENAFTILSSRLHITVPPSPNCHYRYYITWGILDWEPLRAYSPGFDQEFSSYLADIMYKNLYSHLSSASCLYYMISGKDLIIYVG